MSRWTMFLCSLAVVGFSVALAGCGGEKADVKPSPEDAKIQAALAELPPADRAAAEKQRVCPVSGERLGLMGKPVKTTVKDSKGQDHEVFLCCPGCESTIQGDPDTYLAKLNK
jgi:Cu(I)/Ag(I) efflux system membrane fusion protein